MQLHSGSVAKGDWHTEAVLPGASCSSSVSKGQVTEKSPVSDVIKLIDFAERELQLSGKKTDCSS